MIRRGLFIFTLITMLFIARAYAVTCFYKGEVVDGMNKICYYDCLGSTAAITIDYIKLCPLTIEH